ncbi:MAG: outer membrane lipoprotein chaperone LolA [Gammaproteobacteria bacterium]
MIQILRSLSLLFFLLAAGGSHYANAVEQSDPLAFFLEKLESFQADFKQTLTNEQGELLETSTGKVYMQNPGRYRWEYEEPYVQLLITDSQTLWIYDHDLEQVTIKDVSNAIDDTPAAIISGKKNINENFVVVNMGVIEGYDWIELTPRDIDNQYRTVKIGFDKNNLGMMILNDNLGQITRIDFLNPERNNRFGGPLFTFEMPEGVDIIDERQVEKTVTEPAVTGKEDPVQPDSEKSGTTQELQEKPATAPK